MKINYLYCCGFQLNYFLVSVIVVDSRLSSYGINLFSQLMSYPASPFHQPNTDQLIIYKVRQCTFTALDIQNRL